MSQLQAVVEVAKNSNGRIVSVRPRPEVMPLFAAAVVEKDWRSRPGSDPEYRTLGGIVVEGIEELVRWTDTVA